MASRPGTSTTGTTGTHQGTTSGHGGHQHHTQIPHEKIAQRAYEKWVKRGRPQGSDRQDWMEAEAELRAEMGRTGQQPSNQPRR